MTPDEFDYITQMLKANSGLSLTKDKVYLVESRLQPLARARGLNTVEELIKLLKQRPEPAVMHEIVQAMTTNETMFFRDNKPFINLREKLLPSWLQAHPGKKHLRIWSAACSSGQEPYTIGMCLKEDAAKLAGFTFDIVATDLCEKMVDKAARGVYSQFEVQRGLPIQMLLKYFQQGEENQWHVKDDIRRMVKFQSHNLLEDCAKFGKFDIIFCRNVLIYFDEPTKVKVLTTMAKALSPPGYIALGSAETIFGMDAVPLKSFMDEPGLYTLK